MLTRESIMERSIEWHKSQFFTNISEKNNAITYSHGYCILQKLKNLITNSTEVK